MVKSFLVTGLRPGKLPSLRNSMTTFDTLGLDEAVLRAVHDKGYTEPTEIQARAIPPALEGRDIIGASQTGTGKTAAFALPVLSRLGQRGKLRCLVLEPTRELASQVMDAFAEYGKHTDLRYLLMHGGVGYGYQNDGLKNGIDVLVATPGRLLDHLGRGTCKLGDIDVLILDEVDRMLDMGFLPDVRRIVGYTPNDRQTLFFSATMPPQIESLAKWALKDPVEIEIGIRLSAAETVSHAYYPVSTDQRDELLDEILRRTDFDSLMIFTRTKVGADKLARRLLNSPDADYEVTVMHSDIRQRDREKALQGFKEGKFDVIVATDLAARGLDISGVTHVINYNVPENAEDYVHRIGRTGRAKKEGEAFTIITAEELPFAQSIERLIKQKVERKKLEGFPYIYSTIIDDNPPDPEQVARVFGKKRRGPKRRKR